MVISIFGVSLPAANSQRVLITVGNSTIQWTCFDDDTADDCCRSIQAASQEASIRASGLTTCAAQLAKVPVSIGGALQVPKDSFATYSLTLESNATTVQSTQQFMWDDSKEGPKLKALDTAIFPYLISAELSTSLLIRSELSSSGGMHRLLRHSWEVTDDYRTCLIFLTVPSGMFVDLDDAFEGHGATHIIIHAAEVCDIEQPAFVSRPHSIIFEVRDFQDDQSFASKLHLRYPLPSPVREQYVYLPEPQLLCVTLGGSLAGSPQQKDMEPVWVAAGNDHDYNVVMWTTVLVCLIGVVQMMVDISQVARWDE